jgi:Flp pilus assembly protein TadB
MSDDFLTSLQPDWRRDTIGETELAKAFDRHRQWMVWVFASGIGGALCVLACFLWLARTAVTTGDPLLAISALAFAVALPVIFLGLKPLSFTSRQLYELSPIGLLQQTRDRCQTQKRLLTGARWCAAILAAAGLAALIAAELEKTLTPAVCFIVAVWSGTALVVWIWQARRRRQLSREIERLDTMIAEFDAADQMGA